MDCNLETIKTSYENNVQGNMVVKSGLYLFVFIAIGVLCMEYKRIDIYDDV